MKPVCTRSAERHQWGDACDGWHLLAGDDLSVIEETPPGAAHRMRNESMADARFIVISAPKSHGDWTAA